MKKEKLESVCNRFEVLEKQLSDQDIISQQDKYQKIAKEYAQLKPICELYKEFLSKSDEKEKVKQMLKQENNPEMVELAKDEFESLSKEINSIERKIEEELIEDDPYSARNVIVEIRAGTGGDEASLFAADIFRMYDRYVSKKGLKLEILSSNPTQAGGYKEIIFSVQDKNAYKIFKHESGVHRVQRVPATESSGRIHTSAASVVVLPEAEEIDIDIDSNDLRIDVFRSSGPGGQSVNTADSAVRITHLPTNTTVRCQDERSQLKNKIKAMRILRTRLLDKAQEEQEKTKSQSRRTQIGSGDRSEKIRTYNFPQGRVTDHRINFTLYKLDGIMQGDLDELFNRLQEEELKLKKENI